MIQPINPAIQNCYSYGRTFKGKPKFTGYYNPTIVHVTSDMQQGATDTLGKIADKMKDAASKINETFFKEVPNAAKESMVAGGVAAGGNTVLDGNNLVNEETGEYTHILPSGDTVTAIATSPSLKLIFFILLCLHMFRFQSHHYFALVVNSFQ